MAFRETLEKRELLALRCGARRRTLSTPYSALRSSAAHFIVFLKSQFFLSTGVDRLVIRSGFIIVPLFFFLASFLGYTGLERFNSPDETASYFFSKTFAETGRLSVGDPLLLETSVIHPRSVNVRGDQLVPGSFIGLMLIYGGLAKILGTGVIQFLTPFFATLALVAFYFLIKRLFDRKVAIISSLIWLIHPAIVYYTARGLLPNMLFISLVTIAAFWAWNSIDDRPLKFSSPSFLFFINKRFFSFTAGLTMAGALAVRPSEIIWLGPLLLVFLILNFKKINRQSWLAGVIGVFMVLAPLAYYQNLTFGAPWRTGYHQLETVGGLENELSGANSDPIAGTLVQFKSYILPFGFNPENFWSNAYGYLVVFFWWLTVPAIWGLVWLLRRFKNITWHQKWYLIAGFFILTVLVIYYGSGRFVDSTLNTATIGTSYVRYWLPVYIWSIPLAALALIRWKRLPSFFSGLVIIFLSLGISFWFTPESLGQIKKNLRQYQQINQQVQAVTEPAAIIITSRTDKFFFPQRRVIHFFHPDYAYLEGVNKLIKRVPIYFFTLMPQPDVDHLNLNQFGEVNLELQPVKRISQFTLHRVVARPL